MNIPKLNDREKALENEYIRKREQEKFKQSAPQPGSTSGNQQTGSANQGTKGATQK